MPPSSTYFLPGDRIDNRYKVNEVKRGAMGIVFLCMDAKTAHPIALKTFQDHFLKTEESRQKFLEEALLWIELGKHPCIVQAYGLRLIEEKPYLLVERIQSDNPRGVTLKDHIYTHTLKIDFILRAAINICDAMIHAEKKFPNFVHGDLKPENVLLGDDRIPKLTDFGIATHLQMVDHNTSTLSPYELATRMVGTPAFASPEQCRLQVLDTRSDIYSFGCILYQMVTKQVPFLRNEVAEYIHAHLHHSPTPPDELQPDIPHDLSNITLKCLRKSPLERYLNFNELKEDLNHSHIRLFSKPVKSLVSDNEFTYEEHIERAWSFALLGRYLQADQEFNALYKHFGGNPELDEHLARYHYAKHDYPNAQRFVKQALRSNPHNEALLELHGLIRVERSQWKEAETLFKRILSKHPARAGTYRLLSNVYRHLNKEEQREILLQKGIEHCDYDEDIVNECLILLLEKKKYSQVKVLAKQALEIHADHPEILLRLAQAHAATRENLRALDLLRQIARDAPESFEFWRTAGTIYLHCGEYPQAYDAFNNALLYDEGDGAFYADMAEMSLHLKRYDEAWRLAEKAENLGTDTNQLKDKIKRKRFTI